MVEACDGEITRHSIKPQRPHRKRGARTGSQACQGKRREILTIGFIKEGSKQSSNQGGRRSRVP